MKRTKSVFSILLCIFLMSPTVEAKRAKATTKKGKASYQEPVQKYKAMPFLTLRQAGQLNRHLRVRYVHQLREAWFLAEELAIKTGILQKKRVNSQLFQNHWELWSLLLNSENAFAAEANSDTCIYAANVVKKINGACSLTKELACNKARAQNGERTFKHGARCAAITGLTNEYNCVELKEVIAGPNGTTIVNPLTDQLTHTHCAGRITEFTRLHEKKISDLKAEYNEILKKHSTNSEEDLKARSEFMKNKKFTEYGADPEIFADMIKLAADYLEAGKEIPDFLDNFRGDESVRGLVNVAKGENVFSKFDDKIAELQGKLVEGWNKCREPSDKVPDQKTITNDYIRCTEARKAGNPRYKDCNQTTECDFFIKEHPGSDKYTGRLVDIVAALHRRLQETHNTLPVDPPRDPAQDKPAQPADSLKDIGSYGCENQLRSDGILEETPMACLACSFEKDILENEDKNLKHGSYEDYERSGISKRWLLLLNVIARTCGNATSNFNNNVSSKTALEYVQIYGHCSAAQYDWNGVPSESQVKGAEILQSNNIERMNLGELQKAWGDSTKRKISKEDYLNEKFEELFGYRLYDGDVTPRKSKAGNKKSAQKQPGLASLFCPGYPHDLGRVDKRTPEDRLGDLISNTGEIGRYKDGLEDREKKADAQALMDCIAQANRVAKANYLPGFRSNKNTKDDVACYKKSIYVPTTDETVTELAMNGFNNNDRCYTPHQIEYTNGGGKVIRYSSPRQYRSESEPIDDKYSAVITVAGAGVRCSSGACDQIDSFYYNDCLKRDLNITGRKAPKATGAPTNLNPAKGTN